MKDDKLREKQRNIFDAPAARKCFLWDIFLQCIMKCERGFKEEKLIKWPIPAHMTFCIMDVT